MKRRSVILGITLIGLVIGLPLGLVSCRALTWKAVKQKVRHDFPDVRSIHSAELAEWMSDPKREPPLLLDVRTQAEYEVSHLHGARRIEPGSGADKVEAPRSRPIVTYCSVGYRSADFAQKLNALGFKNVTNLEGSIFEWANEGRPVERNGQPADKVHIYNKTWGRLLKPRFRSDVSRADGK